MGHNHYLPFPDWWTPLQPSQVILVLSLPSSFIIRAPYWGVWHTFVLFGKWPVVTSPCVHHGNFSAAHDRVLSRRALDLRLVLDLRVSVPVLSYLWQLKDDIGFLSIADSSSLNLLLSHLACYPKDELNCSVFDLLDSLVLDHFAAGLVLPLRREVLPGCKHARGHRLSYRLFVWVPRYYLKRSSLALDEVAWFVFEFLDRVLPVIW